MDFIAPRTEYNSLYLHDRFLTAYAYFFPTAADQLVDGKTLIQSIDRYYMGFGVGQEHERNYHDLTHIQTSLDVLDFIVAETAGRLSNKEIQTLVLAIFFHDVVMDFERHDNEEASVEYMENSISAGTPLSDKLRHMILATKHKVNTENDFLTQIFLDIDLWVLGDPDFDRFYTTTARIRAEYRHLDDGAFLRGRVKFLEQMVARGPIFYNPLGLNLLFEMEPNAMTNMTTELTKFQSILDDLNYLNRFMK